MLFNSIRFKIGTLVISIIAFYLSYHILMGNRGLFSMIRLEDEVIKTKVKHQDLSLHLNGLKNKVQLLQEDTKSTDLLEEEAIRSGVIPKGAIIINDKQV